MKSFYSVIDAGFVKYAPQPLQHLAGRDRAAKLGGQVVMYTAEDPETLASHMVLQGKLAEKPKVDGFIFFRLYQFCYGERPRVDILRSVLDHGYEIHFSREPVSITKVEDLDDIFILLYTLRHVEHRDASPRTAWQAAWAALP